MTKIISIKEEVHIPERSWLKEVTSEDKRFLQKIAKRFLVFLKFLLLSQSVFFSYSTVGGRTITVSGDQKLLKNLKSSYCYQDILKFLKITNLEVLYWYKLFVQKAEDNLGGIKANSNGWLQLWKKISWSKKKILKGAIRIGSECLQWAYMIKSIIEFSCKQEIPDVDEISSTGFEDIPKINLNQWGGHWNQRHIRNWRNIGLSKEQYDNLTSINSRLDNSDDKKSILSDFKTFRQLGFKIDWKKKVIIFDETKLACRNYYKDKLRHSYYLANSFGLDYQSRLTLFVEGPTEESLIPEIMKWYYSAPYDIGIDIISINGVDNWFGGKEIDFKDQFDGKPVRKLISNFNSLLTYNINRWQILPYLVMDNEGTFKELLDKGLELKIQGETTKFTSNSRFIYIWGETNNNAPYVGSNFELANFSNEEIVTVLRKYMTTEVSIKMIQELRDQKKGFSLIKGEDKPKLSRDLFQNLRVNFEKGVIGNEVFDRPIFKMIDVVINLALLNHQPGDWISETTNRSIIKEMISGTR